MLRWIKKVVTLFLLVFFFILVVMKERKLNLIVEEKVFLNATSLLVILNDTSRHLVKTLEDERHRQYHKCWNEIIASKFQNIRIKHGQNMDEIHHTINNICTRTNINCPAPNFKGYIGVNVNISSDLKEAFMSNLSFVYQGGWWSPPLCNIKTHTVAIIIPFRDREEHLPVLIQHLHPILQRQQLHYRFFVLKQDKDYSFNKGMLVNAGIKEILQLYPYDCLIIQDVDLVPEDDRIDYSCKVSPKHLAARIDKYNYTLHSENNFGGVVSLSTEHYIQINGFSNLFWSWGGEDDNMHQRIVMSGLKQKRENLAIARYTMLNHVNRMYTRTDKEFKDTYRLMRKAKEHWKADGYNSIVYRMNEMKVEDLYTSIEFNLVKDSLIP